MARLRSKLSLFNLLSKLVFTALFLAFMPYLVERINLIQTDNDLIQKREQVISLISKIGIEPFIASDSTNAFGSYNILKEDFISIERTDSLNEENFIEETSRMIDNEKIDYRVLNYTLRIDGKMYLLSVGKSLASIQHTQSNIRLVMLLFLAFIIIITYFTDLQYTRKLLRPLDIITNKLKGISDPSIFDRKQVATTTSDFVKLDNALIELMDNIDQLFRKEKEITVNISHELLTPVSVIRSKLENLMLLENISPEVTDKIEESLKTLHRLQSLVNSLLMIARLESKQYLKEDSFYINDLFKEIADEILPVADDSHVALTSDFSEDFLFNNANRTLLFSMFYNVVNNAVRNTPREGKVVIKSYLLNNNFRIDISDTGKGISSESMNSLFSRFKTRTSADNDGIGIGLAIAKSIADFHGIDIRVNSELDKGTIFSFIIPENS